MQVARALEPIAFSPVPLYTQVREVLRERILDGTYAPHAQLPSESEMVALFKVSRITVRQALSDLQRENLIFKIPGKGTFVAKPKAFQHLGQLEGFAEAMVRMGYEIRNQVTSHKTVPASSRCAATGSGGGHAGGADQARAASEPRAGVLRSDLPAPRHRGAASPGGPGRARHLLDPGKRLRHRPWPRRSADRRNARGRGAFARAERARGNGRAARGAPHPHGRRRALDFEDLYFRGDAFQHRLRIARANPTTKAHP